MGVVPYARAKELAAEAGEDLVLVSDTSNPPVVRIMNFGKLCYEQKKNQKAQRKNNVAQKLKEVKFHINIDQHDYETKLNRALDFLQKKLPFQTVEKQPHCGKIGGFAKSFPHC